MLVKRSQAREWLSRQSATGRQLGLEYPVVNEDAVASEMVNELVAQVDRMYKDKRMLRQIHTKMHGCVKAVFTVEADLPADLKVGVFKEARTYHAWVRLSNSSTVPKPDKKKDVRGFAIKLMGVPGEKLLNDEHLHYTQDFLLMNTETFFSKNVGEFRSLLAAATSRNKLKMVAYALNPLHWKALMRYTKSNVRCSNPLELNYWSTQPYQFGDVHRAVKYFLKPHAENNLVVSNETDDDYLRVNLAQTLYSNEAKFDFYVQFQADAEKMPIEDPTVKWASPFVKLATLTIPPQVFDAEAQVKFGDNLSFNSWHSLPEHRPLGSFNRVRKRVYEALSEYRHRHNQTPVFEPEDSNDFLADTLPVRPAGEKVPSKKIAASRAAILVNTTTQAAFDFISSSEKLKTWLRKYGAIHAVSSVEVIKGPYSAIGAKRVVTFDNGDTIQEELLSYNPAANYSYRISAFSNFFKHLTNAAYGQLWFDRVGNNTRITWEYRYTYRNFFAGIVIRLFCKLIFTGYMKHSLKNAKEQMEAFHTS